MDGEDEKRWLEPAELQAWLAYIATTSLVLSGLDRQLQRDAGMPHAYYQILVILSAADDRSMRMSELAVQTQSSQSRLSHAVARLEEKGWVRRRPSAQDRRSTYAELTDEGFAVLAAAAPGHVETVRRFLFDQLSPEQVGHLHDIMLTVLNGMGVSREEVPAQLVWGRR